MSSLFFCLLTFFFIPQAMAQDNFLEHIQQAQESIVGIKTELTKVMHADKKAAKNKRQASFNRSAVGIIIDNSGLVVTNTHTIIHAPFIFVILRDGSRLPAKIVFTSKTYDFSFLRVKLPYPIKPMKWADSQKIDLSKSIMAIGNDQPPRTGKITGLIQDKSKGLNEFIKMNLNLHHGDSGGPVLDYQGRLLGIIMAKEKNEEHVSFAIAANKIHEQYLKYKKKLP